MRFSQFILGIVLFSCIAVSNTKADVTIGNNADTVTNTSTNTLTIRFVTNASRNALSSIQLSGSDPSDLEGWTLTTGSGGGTTVASASNVTMTNGFLSFGGSPEFGSGEYWLTLSNLSSSTYKLGLSSGLTSNDEAWIPSATAKLVTGNGSTTDVDLSNSFAVALTVSVPEPGTMALGAIALASGGVGTWWRRRGRASATTEA